MLNIVATMHIFTTAFQARVKELRSEERGSVTLEQVIITAALFLAAGALIVVIGNAIKAESGKIGGGA